MEQIRTEDGAASRPSPPVLPPRVPGQGEPPPAPQRHSVRAQVLTALRRALLAGELAPGEVYSAPALASRYGVSPTPVREAMQQLAAEGAVETMPNRGFRVCRHTAQEAAELREIRALLEVPAVLRAAAAAPDGYRERARRLAEAAMAAAAAGDRTAYAEADRAFHRALVDAGGNGSLGGLAEEVHRRAQWAAWTAAGTPALRPASRLVAAASEHRAILDALEAGEAERAGELLSMHLEREGE
ncbi:GntR family transcriptional regulator [Streptomyces xiaopingdaonensis]|uniref:GntR family transcriptional regulator n=1 Tax=Streptomyces xiaopingdaonensis TaxID=1565415 RepID=UPI0002DC9E53|nr:GntR family transcriptional regulator [Streptomyces xiaopingdaonensis]